MARKSTKADPAKKPAADQAAPDPAPSSDKGEAAPATTEVPAALAPKDDDAGADQAIAAPASDTGSRPERDPNKGAEGLAAAVTAALASPDTGEVPFEDQPGPDSLEVVVIGPTRGFWRAGRHFTKEPTVIAARDLTNGQFKALHDEPNLIVSVRELPVAIKA